MSNIRRCCTLQGIEGFLCLYFWVAYSIVDPDPDPHGSTLIMDRLDPDPHPGGQQLPTKIEKS
jgi:hypothetical protein